MRPLAVYVHIPFCTVKCGYCDFNAYAGLRQLQGRYGEALVAEVRSHKAAFEGREVSSIGFGGGTPGEMPPAAIAAVIEAVRELAPLATDAEITLEANPGTTNLPELRELRAAGVNRLSLGAQSFDTEELHFLDRIHSPEAIGASVRAARRAGIASVNLDLIYALPGQSLEAWERSLRAAMALDPDHISTYALTVEEGTPLALKVQRGAVVPADPDVAADMYEAATDILAGAGYKQYELSNWTRPGHESRHNLTYWTDGEYLGVGAGAHGYLGGERYENLAHPRAYIEAVEAGRSAVAHAYRPSRVTAMVDWLSLALRLTGGFGPERFCERFGVAAEDVARGAIRECAEAGIVEVGEGNIRLSRRGRLLHGEVAVRILREVEAALTPGPSPVRAGEGSRMETGLVRGGRLAGPGVRP